MATLCTRRLISLRNYKILRQMYRVESTAQIRLCHSELFISCLSKPTLSYHQVFSPKSIRYYTETKQPTDDSKKPDEKKSLLQRFKQMYRDYWYVLVPVHFVTSAAWFGGFYYMAKSGVDIPSLLDSFNVSEKITNKLRDSSMGYLAVSYALYKIATPLRYTVTLGGTTLSINYLKKWGYIKPVPSKDQLKEMYKEQKENIMESIKETKGFYKEKKESLIRDTKIELKLKKHNLQSQKDSLVKDIEKGIKKIKKTTKIED